jgi:3-isopropylmalate dehydrogenase
MSKKKIVALGGDGIGIEVMDATCAILEKSGFNLEIIKPLHGAAAIKAQNNPFPDESKDLCDESDAILFGAAEGPSIAILIYLRWLLDNYINLRPIKYYPGTHSPIKDPEGTNYYIIRENSEGLYPGREGDLPWMAQNLANYKDPFGRSLDYYGAGKFSLLLTTEKGTQRLARFTSDFAMKRKAAGFPGKVTCITKSNVLSQTGGLFKKIIEEEIKAHSELTFDHYYVDDFARRIVRNPQQFDVAVTTNMFGDILADGAAEVVGGLGIAPSACLGGKKAYFEPVHGTAPDIAGKGIANPTAMILSAKMMLEYLGMQGEADSLEKAVAEVYRKGISLTGDQGGKATTKEFADVVLKHIR